MVEVVIFFLGVSILFYCLFAGADFGAGIVEAFSSFEDKAQERKLITQAMGPVWEANHIWIILAVVIMFTAFPLAFRQISITFHIPILILLVGITLRGCAFTFRHYDAVKDDTQAIYSRLFQISSVLTPLMLGVIAGGLFARRIPKTPESFVDGYLTPWLNLFCFSLGVFVCALFAFLAAVYLLGETPCGKLRDYYVKTAIRTNIISIFSGAFVFVSCLISGVGFKQRFFADPYALLMMALATLIIPALFHSLRAQRVVLCRALAAAQVSLILFGWFRVQYPKLIHYKGGEALDLTQIAAPDLTLKLLVWALVFGSLAILPSLIFLMRTFWRAPTRFE